MWSRVSCSTICQTKSWDFTTKLGTAIKLFIGYCHTWKLTLTRLMTMTSEIMYTLGPYTIWQYTFYINQLKHMLHELKHSWIMHNILGDMWYNNHNFSIHDIYIYIPSHGRWVCLTSGLFSISWRQKHLYPSVASASMQHCPGLHLGSHLSGWWLEVSV